VRRQLDRAHRLQLKGKCAQFKTWRSRSFISKRIPAMSCLQGLRDTRERTGYQGDSRDVDWLEAGAVVVRVEEREGP
jgi:hypothetical protein